MCPGLDTNELIENSLVGTIEPLSPDTEFNLPASFDSDDNNENSNNNSDTPNETPDVLNENPETNTQIPSVVEIPNE